MNPNVALFAVVATRLIYFAAALASGLGVAHFEGVAAKAVFGVIALAAAWEGCGDIAFTTKR